MNASIDIKIYFFVNLISCVYALQFINRNGNKHPILSSVYDVIKLNQIDNSDSKMTNDVENMNPPPMKQQMTMKNPNNRRYSVEDYDYEDSYQDPYDYSVAETKHK